MIKKLSLGTGLIILLLCLLSSWLLFTESGLNWLYRTGSGYFPGDIRVDALHGRLIGPVSIKGLHITHEKIEVSAEQLDLEWQAASLLTTAIHIQQLNINNIHITLPEPDNSKQQASTDEIQLPDIQLPWRLIMKQVALNLIHLKQGEQQYPLEQLTFSLSTLLSQLTLHSLKLKHQHASLAIDGKLQLKNRYRHKLNFEWNLPAQQHNYAGKGQLRGNLDMTQLHHLSTGDIESRLDLTAKTLIQNLTWDASATINSFNSTRFLQDTPALSGDLALTANGNQTQAFIDGQFEGDLENIDKLKASFKLLLSPQKITLQHLDLSGQTTGTQLHVSGYLNEPDGQQFISLQSRWNNLNLPIDHVQVINSPLGKLNLEGTLQDYQFTLSSQLKLPVNQKVLDSKVDASGTGTLQSLTLSQLRIDALSGYTDITAKLNWNNNITWQANISAHTLDPALIDAHWPGSLNAQLTLQGNYQNSQMHHALNIHTLNGHLRTRPISAEGHIDWNKVFQFKQLRVSSGESSLQLDGTLSPGQTSNSVNWNVDSPRLEDFHPDLSGSLKSHGQLSGNLVLPKINAFINASKLGFADFAVDKLTARIDMDLERFTTQQLKFLAEGISLEQSTINQLNINGSNQLFTVSAILPEANIDSSFSLNKKNTAYNGKINSLNIHSQPYGNWTLESPAGFSYSEQQQSLEKLCIIKKQDASFCAMLQHKQTQWFAELTGTGLPLNLFSPWLADDMNIEGQASLHSSINFKRLDAINAEIKLDLSPGSISFPLANNEVYQWKYHTGILSSTLNSQGLQGTLELQLINDDQLTASVRIDDAKPGNWTTQPLQGDLQLQLTDFTPLEFLIPEVDDARGQLSSRLRITGSIKKPAITGQLDLNQGTMNIPPLGLSLEQIRLQASASQDKQLTVSLSAHSGDGQLDINSTTQLSADAGWLTEITARGRDFTLMHIPEATVHITPDVNIRLQHKHIAIKGDVHIPYAKLQPRDISTADRVSDDAIIIGQEVPADKWQSESNIRLTLGERVHLYGYGFEGRLEGNLLLEDSPGQPPTGTGEISIPEGRYRAYGQRLDIEQGRLLFAGGPLVNPGLDFRAVRKINQVTAGLKVRGNLQKPTLELFSEPVMGQTDALSYLLLGRPLESASGDEGNMMAKAALAMGLTGGDTLARTLGETFGFDDMRIDSNGNGDQASLIIGRYLSPRLYVSYGVGILESVNTLFLRYEISEQWQIKAESGEHQGADVQYTFER